MVSMATDYAILKNGVYLQNTHITETTQHRTLNLVTVPNLFLDITIVICGSIFNYPISIIIEELKVIFCVSPRYEILRKLHLI